MTGGPQTQTVKQELDPALRDAALETIDQSRTVAARPHIPYPGPTMAWWSQPQMEAMRRQQQAYDTMFRTSAMRDQRVANRERGLDPVTGMPRPESFGGGYFGLNPLSILNEAMGRVPEPLRRMVDSYTDVDAAMGRFGGPGQRRINPTTGQTVVEQVTPEERYRQAILDNDWSYLGYQ